ncbi:MAG: RHS repeat-associated core domain-containing protein, partial [Acholeplasmataceae bacterium]|nr:RHS repeat-associated core domain-containing protein [Acholeplasmataceae bacterium]
INLVDSRTSYANKSYQWDGRQLSNYLSYCNSMSFKYNDQGMRTQKFQGTCSGSITTNYTLDEDRVLVESRSNGIILYFTYDVDGTLLSMNYNGTEYFYITNMQGDIIELVDINGTSVVKYKYDAWGNIISQTGGSLADINPYRYRGYRYDVETGLYYLHSRYYDPSIGRFISADGLIGEKGNILSHNMYSYANNNPVMMIDPNGTFALTITLGGALLITTALLLVIAVNYMTDSGLLSNSNGIMEDLQNISQKLEEEKNKLIVILSTLVISNLSSLGKHDLHHIVARKDPRAYFSRLMLNRAGIDENTDIRNLARVSRPMHWVMHTNAYHASVTVILWVGYSINGEQGVIDALKITKDVIQGASGAIG